MRNGARTPAPLTFAFNQLLCSLTLSVISRKNHATPQVASQARLWLRRAGRFLVEAP